MFETMTMEIEQLLARVSSVHIFQAIKARHVQRNITVNKINRNMAYSSTLECKSDLYNIIHLTFR